MFLFCGERTFLVDVWNEDEEEVNRVIRCPGSPDQVSLGLAGANDVDGCTISSEYMSVLSAVHAWLSIILGRNAQKPGLKQRRGIRST